VQEKLLRLLQEQEVARVGTPVPQKVDVRIIAATTGNLEDEIKKGNFSEKLFSMLRETVIDIPPLRKTPEMIPAIVNHFLERYGAKYKKEMTCPEEIMSIFLSYRWPGNVLELRNTIQNLMVSCEGDKILRQNLPPCMDAGKSA
jgi:two-component system response regulator AtoC